MGSKLRFFAKLPASEASPISIALPLARSFNLRSRFKRKGRLLRCSGDKLPCFALINSRLGSETVLCESDSCEGAGAFLPPEVSQHDIPFEIAVGDLSGGNDSPPEVRNAFQIDVLQNGNMFFDQSCSRHFYFSYHQSHDARFLLFEDPQT